MRKQDQFELYRLAYKKAGEITEANKHLLDEIKASRRAGPSSAYKHNDPEVRKWGDIVSDPRFPRVPRAHREQVAEHFDKRILPKALKDERAQLFGRVAKNLFLPEPTHTNTPALWRNWVIREGQGKGNSLANPLYRNLLLNQIRTYGKQTYPKAYDYDKINRGWSK